jgi:hypothetical protein
MTSDPLDAGKPAQKRWEEFRRALSQALLLQWLFQELNDIYPDYPSDLWGRLQSAACDYPEQFRKEGDYDGWVPLTAANDKRGIIWMHEDEVNGLIASLFPHGFNERKVDVAARAMVAVALHSALEFYAVAVGVKTKKGLPKGIRAYLKANQVAEKVTIETVEILTELDATRHIVIHNNGVVDEAYIRAVAGSHLMIGERRALTDDDLHAYAQAIRYFGDLIRQVDADPP